MTVLLPPAAIRERAGAVQESPSLLRLARSLRDDLTPLLARGEPWIPPEKARMTRIGGRCPSHGVLLDFDPWEPHAHRCPTCGTVYREAEHYRWWIMNYQLWLAERAVHAALLAAITPDPACDALAGAILRAYARRYAAWPNRDNVLGPTRPFFSTYLESIWVLQLAVALDLLEARHGRTALGDEVRERLLAPSAALIASYDEGRSNRQVYHNAALAACGALLGDDSRVERALRGPSGLAAHAASSLLPDGTWYEGENYHLFAHRGLWYGVTIADALGVPIPAEGRRRVHEGFATPFATALPDLTFPARRDSQYKVSLRQWRMAESCELGLARHDDPRLVAALAALYDPTVPAGDSGRARSTAEAERNVPAARLDRASLGWKALLVARPAPSARDARPHPAAASVHLTGQGLAVFRRDGGHTYVALDYGESGGGHGHPDRLNVWLVPGRARVLEDVGTGSYVDPTLHWYRSTLAHNAPLVDGRSQQRVTGRCLVFDEREGSGIVSAQAVVAPGVRMTRTVVVMDHYLVDELRWEAPRDVTVDLPWHVDLAPDGNCAWRPAALLGGDGSEDGFRFLTSCEVAPGELASPWFAEVDGAPIRAWFRSEVPHEWWRCVAPGPPGASARRFVLQRARGARGVMRSVWSWRPGVRVARFAPDEVTVARRDEGEPAPASGWDAERGSADVHRWGDDEWRVSRRRPSTTDAPPELRWPTRDTGEPAATVTADDSRSSGATTGGDRLPAADGAPATTWPSVTVRAPAATARMPGAPGALAEEVPADDGVARFVLGEAHYRRSEATWAEAGAPTARVAVAATRAELLVDVSVRKAHPTFASPRPVNPLDNEHPDTNSDGVQLYLAADNGHGERHAWLLVPEGVDGRVRVTPRAGDGTLTLTAAARLTPAGWALRAAVPRRSLGRGFTLDLVINEITPGRERRQGQLTLREARGEWVYLRGDRQDPERSLHVFLADG